MKRIVTTKFYAFSFQNRRDNGDPVEAMEQELIGELLVGVEEKTYSGSSLKCPESPGSLM